MSANGRHPVLFVVHPGSACGSADFNLGAEEADACRQALAADIGGWRGGMVIIDGALSDELSAPDYQHLLGHPIRDGLQLARDAGCISARIDGDAEEDEQNQEWAAREVVRRFDLTPENTEISVTGCWYHSQELSGCVTSVKQALEDIGFTIVVLPGAILEADDPKRDISSQHLSNPLRR